MRDRVKPTSGPPSDHPDRIDRLVRAAGAPDVSAEEDLRRELSAHFEDAADAHGSHDEADRAFGDDAQIAAALRRTYDDDRRRGVVARMASRLRRTGSLAREVFMGLTQDLRIGVRLLWRQPGFTLLAAACLTVAIGSNAAVLSWIEGLLLRPYPLVADQDRLFAITGTVRGSGDRDDMSWPDFQDLARNSRLVESFIAEKITGTSLATGDHAERVSGSMVSANYFDAIGVHPILGRGFEPVEDTGRNAHPVTVISYELWRDRFGRDPNIIGRTQLLNGLAHTIVGVAPEGFYGTFVGYAFQFWVPASMQAQFSAGVYKLEDRGARWIEGYVRLRPGATMAQAQTELSNIAAELARTYPDTNKGRGVELFPLYRTPFNNAGALLPTLEVALAIVAAVLVIACANVANLLLVRALAREREMVIRLSIGATRARLVRQLLVEGLLLAVIAAVGGLVVAKGMQNALTLVVPPRGTALRLPGELDWRVLALSAGLAFASTLAFALVPALVTTGLDLAGAIREGATSVVGGRGRAWVRTSLILVQMSLSFVLLVGAGLLVKSLYEVRRTSPGFTADEVATTYFDLNTAGYDLSRARVFQDEVLDRVRAIGGVEAAGFARTTPFAYSTYASASIATAGADVLADEQPTAGYNAISPGYLRTLGIPVVSGRDFADADDQGAPLVTIVDDTLASTYWPRIDPVGQRLRVNGKWTTVVGVAQAAKYRNLLEPVRPFFYVPLRQEPTRIPALFVRTRDRSAAFAMALGAASHALDAAVSPAGIQTMQDVIERTTAPQRIAGTMLTVFGVLALALAAVGLYGVVAAVVAQRASELALRSALGAEASDLARLVVSRSLAVAAGGIAFGAATALLVTRLLGYLLYRVSPRDPLAFGAAAVVVAVAALAATIGPAWRAARSDPARVLRA
jgi:predicted permease